MMAGAALTFQLALGHPPARCGGGSRRPNGRCGKTLMR